MKKYRIGVIMDPLETIKPYKDSTVAMMLAAQKRHWELHYINFKNVFIDGGLAKAATQEIHVEDKPDSWYQLSSITEQLLGSFDIVLMRKDPPVNTEYLYICQLLCLAQKQGCKVINDPSALCQINEKLYISWFPELCSPTIVTCDSSRILSFIHQHEDVVLKPLDGMGGASVFRVQQGDGNTRVIIETLSRNGHQTIMAQRFIPDIKNGDKRVLIINGKAVDYALARIPAKGENRANLAAGGTGRGQPLSDRDKEIAMQVGPVLRNKGIMFAGLDIIGDYLTEINVTSPTCIRELDSEFKLDIAGQLMENIASELKALAT